MKNLVLAATLLAGMCGLAGQIHAHGGQYRGPGDTVPPAGGGAGGGGGAGPTAGPAGPTTPGPGGPTTPGPGSPGAPGGAAGGRAVTGTGGDSGADLTLWSFWWEFNKEPYLQLKSKIHQPVTETGSDGWFLGSGDKKQSKDSLKPTEEQVRQTIVPALLQALEKETNNDIVTGCLIALAKIGDPATEGESQFEPIIKKFLADKNQEISETAAVALGILANTKSIPTLEALLKDAPDGRKMVGNTQEVNYRTRAFAAYGLGLIGYNAGNEADRTRIVKILRETIEGDNTKSRDLKVSCIIAMGLVPLETIESAAPAEKGATLPPETSRLAQLDFLLSFLQNEDQNYLVRAHCPSAMARLLEKGLPEQHAKTYREKIANDLITRITKKSDQAEIIQSCVLALGMLGTNDGADPLDKKIREVLVTVPKEVSDQQARNFSMIAMAKVGGTAGARDVDSGVDAIKKALLEQLGDGKTTMKPWAGMACGVMARKLAEKNPQSPAIPTLQQAVREALESEGDTGKVGAYALSAGIMGDLEATPVLLKRLDSEKADDAKGYVAVGLGLLGARDAATEKIQKIVDDSKYRPDLLKQAAIALGLLGDKDVVKKLTDHLAESKGLATQAAISSALGFIGDQRSIAPLVQMLQNDQLTERARGFAAVALGIVADKELLPWNSKIAVDLNYRASTQTLTDTNVGTGILDIL